VFVKNVYAFCHHSSPIFADDPRGIVTLCDTLIFLII
jgi:hypothetical protein